MNHHVVHEIAAPVIPDPFDARDRVFRPADPARALPARVGVEEYRRYVGQTWHQRGQECTGFALAALANYTLRKRLGDPGYPSVSRRMLYEMAQFFDGETFAEGSTLRGALRGWRRVGVTLDDLWRYEPGDEDGSRQGRLTLARLLDARSRRLLRYERIQAGHIETMQHALAEGRALYACARYHVGWFRMYLPGAEPVIEQRPDDDMQGGHAFVIAGYDERGFWIHNSFGAGWGDGGYALLPYADWQANGLDAWVIEAEAVVGPAASPTPPPVAQDGQAAYRAMWPHLVVLQDDGRLASGGPYEMDAGSVGTMLYLFREQTKDWTTRRLAVFADGGYLPTPETIERLRRLRDALMAREIYPLFLVWETSWWAELQDEIGTWLARVGGQPGARPDDPLAAKALDRSVVKPLWSKLIERSRAACAADGAGAKVLAESIARSRRPQNPFELHLVSHGAGDLLLRSAVDLMPAPITSVTTLAPATTVEQFAGTYARLCDDFLLDRMHVLALDDAAEQADRTGPLAGSLLTLHAHFLATAEVEVADSRDAADAEAAPAPQAILGLGRHLMGDVRVERVRQGGQLRATLLAGLTHVDLPFDAGVQRAVIDAMLGVSPPAG